MFKSILFVTILTLGLCACQQDKKNNVNKQLTQEPSIIAQNQTQKKISQKTLVKDKVTQNQKFKSKLEMIHNGIAKKRVFEINNEKFTTNKGHFKKGDQIHNLNINQDGVIKGSIVVVMIENQSLLTDIAKLGQSEKIAKSTYRLTFIADQDLLAMYHRIKKMSGVKIVELEVDYTPKPKIEVM